MPDHGLRFGRFSANDPVPEESASCESSVPRSAAPALPPLSVSPRRAAWAASNGPAVELELHLQAADLLRRGVPAGGGFFFHPPNQGKRSLTTGGLFKGMGMMPGLTDLVLVAAARDGVGRCAFLELKRPDGKGALSPAQVQFRDLCNALGIMWGEAKTLAEVEAFARKFYEACGFKFRASVQ